MIGGGGAVFISYHVCLYITTTTLVSGLDVHVGMFWHAVTSHASVNTRDARAPRGRARTTYVLFVRCTVYAMCVTCTTVSDGVVENHRTTHLNRNRKEEFVDPFLPDCFTIIVPMYEDVVKHGP